MTVKTEEPNRRELAHIVDRRVREGILDHRVAQLEDAMERQTELIREELKDIKSLIRDAPTKHSESKAEILETVREHYLSKTEGAKLQSQAALNKQAIYNSAGMITVFISILLFVLNWKL